MNCEWRPAISAAESVATRTINADEHALMSRMHKPEPALPQDRQNKCSIVPLEPEDRLMAPTDSAGQARAPLRVAHEVFDAGAERYKPQRSLI